MSPTLVEVFGFPPINSSNLFYYWLLYVTKLDEVPPPADHMKVDNVSYADHPIQMFLVLC